MMKETKVCVRCLKKKAVVWAGHVKRGKKIIVAGWCKACRGKPGFVGHWRAEMGERI